MNYTRSLPVIALLLSFAALDAQTQTAGSLIDNFDASKKLQHWSFLNGAEFPGASGKLSTGPGHEGRGAVLTYRFTCRDSHCGQYAAAVWQAPQPLAVPPGAALSLWAQFAPDIRLTLRITDQTGQTLQFHANAPTLEQPSPDEWQQVIVPLTATSAEHWGGANNGQLQGRLTALAILADSGYTHATQGQLNFDDVQLISPTQTIFSLDPALPLTKAPEGSAELRPRLGINIHSLQNEQALDIARDAGFSFVRTDLLWQRVEKEGRYDFTRYDSLQQSLEARGMGVLWVLAYGHPAHGGQSPQSPDDIAAYARFAAAAVSHFHGRNARFEIWNEPNAKRFLANPAVYPNLLRAALTAIRQQDPAAIVATGGTSGLDLPFLAPLVLAGSAQAASAIAVHPYRDAGPETLAADLSLLRHLAGSNLPVWDTEWGYSSSGVNRDAAQKRQAVLTAREVLTVWALNLPVAVLYDLVDDGRDASVREQNFGLLLPDHRPKPALQAVRTLSAIVQSHTCAGLLRGLPNGVHALMLSGADGPLFAVWNDDPSTHPRLQLPVDDLLSITDVLGNRLPAGNDLVLDESAGPLYLRLRPRTSLESRPTPRSARQARKML